jgi:hypothetical protein
MSQRLEVEVDDTTASYLHQRCLRRGDLAAAAAEALRELALQDAIMSLSTWYAAQGSSWLEDTVRDNEAALAELP